MFIFNKYKFILSKRKCGDSIISEVHLCFNMLLLLLAPMPMTSTFPTFLLILLLALSLSWKVRADIYLHNPRGANGRNCERNVNRNNGNRLYDTQNNAKGGYACDRPVSGPEYEANLGGINKVFPHIASSATTATITSTTTCTTTTTTTWYRYRRS